MLQDTQDAIEMDDKYVKAFVANGEAYVELGKTAPPEGGGQQRGAELRG